MSAPRWLCPLLLLGTLGCPEAKQEAQAPEAKPAQTAAPARAGSGTQLLSRAALIPQPTQASTQAKRKQPRATLAPRNQAATQPDDHGDTSPWATAARVGEAVTGVLESGQDADAFALNLKAETFYRVSAHCYGGVEVEVLDPSGRSLGKATRSLGVRAAQSGRHVVLVRAQAGQALHYALEVASEAK